MSGAQTTGNTVRLVCNRFARLHYRVLRHLDLGADRANLFDPELPERAWEGRLVDAYRSSPHRDLVQVLPLWLVGRGEGDAPLSDILDLLLEATGDDALVGALADAYRDETDRGILSNSDETRDRQPEETLETIREPLGRLRGELWSEVDRCVPDLRILDVPALETRRGWTRGRGHSAGGERIVAVSLRVSPVRALLQVFHEEVHPVTDPVVRETDSSERDSRSRAEALALETGRALVASVVPELVDDYDAWQRRFDLAPSG